METDMDTAAGVPSPTSSGSDSDSFNTESARIHFGPLKTPERKFAANASKRLFPPPSNSSLRRSPRLSSPRPRSATPTDLQATREDLEDIEQVARLVHEIEDEDESIPTSGSGTPQNGEVFIDEPSSALADKVLHALDNPSPPPSPPAALSLFDPYHTTVPEVSTDYQADLMSLTITDKPEVDDANPLLITSTNSLPALLPLSSAVAMNSLDNGGAPENLISFDTFMTPPKQHMASFNAAAHEVVPTMSSVILSVDDLLAQSPSPGKFSVPPPQLNIPAVTVQTPENDIRDAGSPMAVDNDSLPATPVDATENLPVPSTSTPAENRPQQEGLSNDTHSTPIIAVEDVTTTPLRRSTRPRRSVTPNPPPTPNVPAVVSPPSIARTQVRRKSIAVDPKDEVVSDSQDEGEDELKSPSRATPVAVRVRHRSPGKTPLSFQRELGSLSPTSANVLSSLAFNPTDDSNVNAVDSSTNEASQPVFSFSVFAPPTTAGPSTPVRNTGPIRFSSPSKGQTSPSKYRIQTPAPNDPTVTPARRIPISEGIAQGHVSPEKAAQLGFKPNGTPLTFVSTPARRVLISDESVPSTSKLASSRLGSPVRTLSNQRERSAEPSLRLGESAKGKEKASVLKRPATVLSKLPFPLVPSEPQPASVVAAAQAHAQDEANKAKSSPFKSNLRQPTSRIPRIGAKPYARSADVKSADKISSTTTPRMVDLAKPPPKPSIVENARRSVRALDSTKSTIGTSSRVKPASTSTAMLKRKREPEKASPGKPRVVILRRVPPLAAAPSEASTSTPMPVPNATSLSAKAKKPSQGPVRIRRVMDPEPLVPLQVTPPAAPSEPDIEMSTIIVNPPQAVKEPVTSKESSPPQLIELDEILPESPAKQTQYESAITPVQQGEEDTSSATIVVTPTVTVTDYSAIEHPTSGLRRTTRSRRTANVSDVFTESSSRPVSTSRRKPSSFQADDIFSGMSITALKDLTTSNTVHNQKYLAAKLETEVIRKEGVRPESPAVKVRTILQRQQDERERQKSERAKRRSRRSGELPSSDIEGSSDIGYSSLGEEHASEGEQETIKHQRGAGDEEDYVTPERPMRHFKRTRLFEDPDAEDPQPPKRRVKWDRGLFTTVYLDEVQLGSRQTLKENMSLKGILAPTAKALRLDTLGNLPYADAPLTDLVQENITVKKIVYDSDVLEPEIVVKNTRSKKK